MSNKIPHPPRVKDLKGSPPEKSSVKRNLTQADPNEIVALNFRVPASFKKDFKVMAAILGITQSALLQEAFLLIKEKT